MSAFWADYATATVLEGIPLVTAGAMAFKANPTLATGDVKVSIDGGAKANIGTLPSAQPASGTNVRISLSAAELTGKFCVVTFIDAAGAEWEDQQVLVYTRNHQSAYDPNGVVRKATAQAGAASTITLDSSASATDNAYRQSLILIQSGTGSGQWNYIVSYVGSTKVATVLNTWLTNPSSDSVFIIYAAIPSFATGDPFARLGAPAGLTISADIAAAKADTAAVKVKTDFLPSIAAGAAGGVFIAGANAATSIATALTANIIGNITGNLSGSAGSVSGAVGSVTGNVGGNVVGTVASVVGAVGSVTGNVGGNVVGTVASVVGAVGSVTGNVGGNVVGTVASVVGAVGSVAGNIGGNLLGNVAGNVTGSVGDVLKIYGSATAANRLQRAADTMILVTVGTGSSTTSIVLSAFAPTIGTVNQVKGAILCFERDTTTIALRGQRVPIASNLADGTLAITAGLLTDAPVNGDTAIIL